MNNTGIRTKHTRSLDCYRVTGAYPGSSLRLNLFEKHQSTNASRFLRPDRRPRSCHATVLRASVGTEGELDAASAAKLLNRKLAKAASLIRSPSSFAPFDRPNFNVALAVWKAVREIPEGERHQLLGRLDSQEIENLWSIAAERYAAHPVDIQNTLGPDFSLWDQFPEEPGEVFVFEGKAAVPAFGRFRKLFFLHPSSYDLYGHVDVGWWPLGRALYPLYYKCSLEQSMFPGTTELTDMQLDYLPLEKLKLEAVDLPLGNGLPVPKQPRWPFSGGLRDYMRPVGPDAFVGRGWKHPASGAADSDWAKGSGFLYFVLIRNRKQEAVKS